MDDGLANDEGKIFDRKKSSAALMADLIIRCVSNKENTKHHPFNRNIFREFNNYPSLLDSYNSSIDYLSDFNLIHSIDDMINPEMKISETQYRADLHKRILIQTWKKWYQNKENQNILESTRNLITFNEKPIFPTKDEIDTICSKFYTPKNNNK